MRNKLLFVIDHLGIGGAQRQIYLLAKGLSKREYKVELFTYFPGLNVQKEKLLKLGINVYEFNKNKPGFSLLCLSSLRKRIKEGSYSSVISFLDTPSIYTELATIGMKHLQVIVSERNSHMNEASEINSLFRRLLHIKADMIVANSKTHAEWLKLKFPWLKKKTISITNGYEDIFTYNDIPYIKDNNLKLIGIGRITKQKNQINLIKALMIFYKNNGWCPKINWVGGFDSTDDVSYKEEAIQLLKINPQVNSNWIWLGKRNDVSELISEHHAMILPSIYEGFPNAVCESLYSGRPVLASNVCDHLFLIGKNERGLLFDPKDPNDIADKINDFYELGMDATVEMSRNARKFALKELNIDKYVFKFEKVLRIK